MKTNIKSLNRQHKRKALVCCEKGKIIITIDELLIVIGITNHQHVYVDCVDKYISVDTK